MPSQLPDGQPAPADGELPETASAGLAGRPFGVYLHVPFCASRCGYCDFNTYTAVELASAGTSVARETFWEVLAGEIKLAGRVLGGANPPLSTVFVGGGTPTLLDAGQLASLLEVLDSTLGIAPGAEVSIEANPESVTASSLRDLRRAGYNRISLGMQSASEHVLRVLERRHSPNRAAIAATEAYDAGFEQVSLDLIYGTPGESLPDWEATLQVALATPVRHVSAYSLIVEEGTRLAAAVRLGRVNRPDDDLMAAMYEVADELLAGAGMSWYEVSNWARPGHECRHNLGYWRSSNWWGVGPGAHSHVGGVRWWNVRHPADYAGRLAGGGSPAAAREILDQRTMQFERVMLGVRLAEGLDLDLVSPSQQDRADQIVSDGLATKRGSVLVLTRRGRLLADAVVRTLLD